MQAKTDWEPSTPAAYFVQSPSHDGEKTTASLNSTPIVSLSPTGSLGHYSGGHGHSPGSSISHCTGPEKLGPVQGSRKAGNDVVLTNLEFDVNNLMGDEEGLCEGDEERWLCFHFYNILPFLVGFFVGFFLFCLILWGVSKYQKPEIKMQSIKFETFIIQAGSDTSGVSTDMISLNSTLKFKYTNTASFFGVHVSSTPISLSYTHLQIASGDVKEFYKRRKQEENVRVVVAGDKIPMYGSGATLVSPDGMTDLPVTLKLDLKVGSRAHVMGKLVNRRFLNKVECFLDFATTKIDVPISLRNCTYHRSL
ncbi:uncharacterized protein LOC125203186 isoform X1 [Salvia hispanica]|uniref:uncharacterized protein LOC125198391 isoform X1 n=1 Tax=Salvia hispanica TaxID=49212 RepID=UPI0020095F22|nr:uncharacterized protein LOC125198391 isoform X1 [Salvia hispanica]XP_047957453.1 uncharacterized protein LOC125203186 isoform X1 [Salvia hispanica]